MSGHLITLDKQTGVCPVGVGETSRCIFAKCVIRVMCPKATNACQDDHTCSNLKPVIDGAVHRVKAIWGANLSTGGLGFLLVDEKTFSIKLIESVCCG